MAIEFNIDTASFTELRKELQLTKSALSTLPADSEAFLQAAGKAGQLKDKMTDINEQVAIFAGGSKFEQAGTALGQVKDALFNLDFKGASERASALTTIVSSISFKEATAGLKDLGSTFLSLGKALLTNPLFLIPALIVGIVSALGLLGPIIDGVKQAFKFLSDAVAEFLEYIGVTNTKLDELNKRKAAAKEASDKQTAAVNTESLAFVRLIAQLKTTNVNSKERADLIKLINKEYGTSLKNIADETKFQNQLNLSVDEYIKKKYAEFTLRANEELLIELFKKRNAAQKEFNAQLKDLTSGYTLVNKEAGIYKSNVTGTNISLGELRSRGQLNNKVMLDQEKILRDVDQQINNIGRSSLALTPITVVAKPIKVADPKKSAADFIEGYQAELEYYTENFELTKPIILPAPEFADEPIDTSIVNTATQEVNDYWAKLEIGARTSYDSYTELLAAQQAEDLRNAEKNGESLDLVQQKYADMELQRQRELRAAKLQIASSGFDLISGLTDLFGAKNEKAAEKAFNVNKAVGMAQAVIQTYQAAQGAYLSQLSIPSPDAPVRASIAAGIAVAAGLTNVAKISATKFKGTTTPSATSSTSTVSSIPQNNFFGDNNNQNNVAATPTNTNMPTEITVKAYVSETEMTVTQQKVAKYKNAVTL